MNITGTHIAYLYTCHRKLWLFAHGIQMEHTSDIVAEGKLISETTYLDRVRKYTELAIEGIKIDFYDAANKVVHEVKKSNKVEKAHLAQVKYYLYILVKNGIERPSAIIEYPKLKQRETLDWDNSFIAEAVAWKQEVSDLVQSPSCPPLVKKTICKKCSYFELCYVGEEWLDDLVIGWSGVGVRNYLVIWWSVDGVMVYGSEKVYKIILEQTMKRGTYWGDRNM